MAIICKCVADSQSAAVADGVGECQPQTGRTLFATIRLIKSVEDLCIVQRSSSRIADGETILTNFNLYGTIFRRVNKRILYQISGQHRSHLLIDGNNKLSMVLYGR